MKLLPIILALLLFVLVTVATILLPFKIKRPELRFAALIIGVFLMALCVFVAYVECFANLK